MRAVLLVLAVLAAACRTHGPAAAPAAPAAPPRPGAGFVDLEPGRRVKIQRAHFREGAEQTLANYAGTTTVFLEFRRARGSRLRFVSAGVEAQPPELAKQAAGLPEAVLAKRASGLPYYRLFLLDSFVPRKLTRKALILGARQQQDLKAATRLLRAYPEMKCADPQLPRGLDCFPFEGPVTVAAEPAANPGRPGL